MHWFNADTLRGRLVAGGLLVLLTAVAYHDTFTGPWLFDDLPNIRDQTAIRTFDPLGFFTTGHNRPVLMATFAANYQLSGLETLGYHATNFLIHLAAGVLLWRLLVHLLSHERVGGDDPAVRAVAWLSAALWLVHPLQTESVTYIVQRAESLMGLLFIATVYLTVRGASAERPWGWYLAAIATTWIGLGCKEVTVTVPAVMALIDRMVLSASWREVARRRGLVYLAMLAVVVSHAYALAPIVRGEASSAGFGQQGHSPLEHLYSEPQALLLYARQTIWPWPQCFDWNLAPVTSFAAAALPGAIVVSVLLAALIAGHFQRIAALPVLIAFIVLAPTSSFVPVLDIAVEHRMYLALAALLPGLVCLVTIGLRKLVAPPQQSSLMMGVACAVLVIATTSTVLRNRVYRSEIALWQSVVDVRPQNHRALNNLATALLADEQFDRAESLSRQALELAPSRDQASLRYNLARALAANEKLTEAVATIDEVIQAEPQVAQPYLLRADWQRRLNNVPAAIDSLTTAAQLKPSWPIVQLRLGECYLAQKKHPQAIERLTRAAELQPDSTTIQATLLQAYEQAGDTAQAEHVRRRLAELRGSTSP
ncbi:MAG: tetratricopeptide repeat protein [Planctomycetaceae bacterium]|nr:tetratricopeptide repeat protein [Planctomycetaceae bacterium]